MISVPDKIKLGVTRNWKKSLLTVVATYGFIWAIIEPINGLIAGNPIQGSGKYITLVIISLVAGIARLFPKTKISLPLHHSDTTIEVEFGDLFAEEGQKVVSVNNCFDSQLGRIVAPTSLHGLFITRELNGISAQFDALVTGALNGVHSFPLARTDGGKPASYPIGTTAFVQWKGKEFYLVALAQTDPNTSICNATTAEFWQALEGLWTAVRINANDGDVIAPLLGSGLARVGLPPSQLLYFLLSSFVAETKRQKVTRHLKVVLHESVFEQIDLSEFERNWTT